MNHVSAASENRKYPGESEASPHPQSGSRWNVPPLVYPRPDLSPAAVRFAGFNSGRDAEAASTLVAFSMSAVHRIQGSPSIPVFARMPGRPCEPASIAGVTGPARIMDAIANGDIAWVNALIQAGMPVNSDDEHGRSPLVAASIAGGTTIVRALLAASAPVNQADGEGNTPLLAAIAAGNTAVIKVLLEAGANPNQLQRSGMTPLVLAILEGRLAPVEALLQGGANPVPSHPNGFTPLTVAEQHEDKRMEDMLYRFIPASWRIGTTLAWA